MGGISTEISRISATDSSGENLSSSYRAGPKVEQFLKWGEGLNGTRKCEAVRGVWGHAFAGNFECHRLNYNTIQIYCQLPMGAF